MDSVRNQLGHHAELAKFADRLGIDRGMALCLDENASGQIFFLALYRSAADPPFDETEAFWLRELTRHTWQLWEFSLRDALRHVATDGLDSMALAWRDGRLVYLGSRMSELLWQGWPEWDGLRLPAAVIEALPAAPEVIRVGRARMVVTPLGDHLQLGIESAVKPHSQLTPRERRVAYLFAQGLSYTAIAQQLGLSPTTVRTYLRQAYQHLGVRTKLELSEALTPRSTLER